MKQIEELSPEELLLKLEQQALCTEQANFFADLLAQQVVGLYRNGLQLRMGKHKFVAESHTWMCEDKAASVVIEIEKNTETQRQQVWKAFMTLTEDKLNRLYIKVTDAAALPNYTFWRAI